MDIFKLIVVALLIAAIGLLLILLLWRMIRIIRS